MKVLWIVFKISAFFYLCCLFVKKVANGFTNRWLFLIFLVRLILNFIYTGSACAEETQEVLIDNKMHDFFMQDVIISFGFLTIMGVNPSFGLAYSIIISILFEDVSNVVNEKLDSWSEAEEVVEIIDTKA